MTSVTPFGTSRAYISNMKLLHIFVLFVAVASIIALSWMIAAPQAFGF